MLAATRYRVEHNTPHSVKQKLDRQLRARLSRYTPGDKLAIDRRLSELDREWNIEKIIETEAPLMIALGLGLGTLGSRRWLALSVAAAAMVIVHNTQGWYPLLPLLRRLGVRSQNEIEEERMALRVLRGDHETYQAPAGTH